MNRSDGLERELTAWMLDVAAPRIPDYLDDIVRSTARRRQRPRWTFPERWLPMTLVTLHPVPTRRFPWRTIGLLAVIAALLAALVVVSVGSIQRRSPAPFGLAANGLVAYATDGDIWSVDPSGGMRRPIVTGPERDHDPRWSPDGTRIAFLRDADLRQQVVIVTADGVGPALVGSRLLVDADDDGLKWAPDGRSLIVPATIDGVRSLASIDAGDGAVTTLPIDYRALEGFWRPPDGRELLFVSGADTTAGLSLYAMDTGQVRSIPLPTGFDAEPRLMGWTPDGRWILVHRWSDGVLAEQTFLIDAETGDHIVLDVGFGHVSNAGDRVAGVPAAGDGAVCIVAAADPGPCRPVGSLWDRPDGTHFEGLQWSPDDRWIVAQPADGSQPVLLDPSGGTDRVVVDWVRSGAESWQRVAP